MAGVTAMEAGNRIIEENIICLLYTSLCYSENGNSVALTGEVEVITDAEIKKELWQEWFIAHFPLGPADPNYVLLKFKGQKATIWIDGVFIHE